MPEPRAAILGVGSTVFGRHPDRSLIDLAVEAGRAAIQDSGLDRSAISHLFVGNFLGGMLQGQQLLAPIIANQLGLTACESITTEGACSSSAIGTHLAVELIAAGVIKNALVLGVEKMTNASAEHMTGSLMSATDLAHDGHVGLTFSAFWALGMRRHMHEYGTRREQISMVTVKNRRNGAKNTYAQFQKEITLEDALDSRLIADPIRLFDCCPATDGAAALVLGPAGSGGDRAVDVLASIQVTGRGRITDYSGLTQFPATVEAAARAYQQAGVEASNLDVVELHDCFSMAEIVDGEDLGLIPKGSGGIAMEESWTDFGGRVVVNASGGLLSKGHPVGATGCGQIFEVVRQLRGEHPNQVPDALLGLTHNAGGTQALVVVHILGARS